AVSDVALEPARSIRPDSDRAETLRAALASGRVGRGDGLFAAVRTIRSDYEKRRVFMQLRTMSPSREMLHAMFETVAGMQSDDDRAELLLAFVNALRSDPRVRQAFVHAAQGIHSSYDQNSLLAGLARFERR